MVEEWMNYKNGWTIGVMAIFIVLKIVIILWLNTYARTIQIILFKYMKLYYIQLYFNKPVRKREKEKERQKPRPKSESTLLNTI